MVKINSISGLTDINISDFYQKHLLEYLHIFLLSGLVKIGEDFTDRLY